jgi:hypothetical protein
MSKASGAKGRSNESDVTGTTLVGAQAVTFLRYRAGQSCCELLPVAITIETLLCDRVAPIAFDLVQG